ncbi:hypothetical protein D9M71_479980 [compost metagenome]
MARQQEAGQALVGLRQGQEGVAHRRRAEPLVPNQFVGLARTIGSNRIGARGVGAHVGAALLLGHRHADGDAGLLLHRHVARVVLGGEDLRQPLLGDIRLQLDRRHGGEGHGQRAAAAGLGLGMQVIEAGTGNLGAGTRIGPRQRRQAMLDGRAHQLVVGRVEFHQVDAMAVAVVGLEHRLVLVGEEAGRQQRATGQCAIGIHLLLGPAAIEAADPFLQRQVDAVEVGAVQRRHLVGDFVGFGVLVRVHFLFSWVNTGAPTARRQNWTRAWLTCSRSSVVSPTSRAARAGGESGPTSASAMAPTRQAALRWICETWNTPLAQPSSSRLANRSA